MNMTSQVGVVAAAWIALASAAHAQSEYHIVARHSGKCLNVAGAAKADKTPIVQWDCSEWAHDNFVFESRGDGYYTISPAHARGSCLDVDWNRRFDEGVQIELYRCHGGDNQAFRLQYAGGQYFQVVSKVSGKCLDVAAHSTSSGAAIIQWNCKLGPDWAVGNGNQYFKREYVGNGRSKLANGWAYIFLRPEMPRFAGHVGWGFQQADGSFYAGAIEGTSNVWVPNASKFHTAYRFETESQMISYFAGFGAGETDNAAYTDYKKIAVRDADPAAAIAAHAEWKNYDYWLVAQNCMDETYAILRAYGATGLPSPSSYWAPRAWFRASPADQHEGILSQRNENHLIAYHSGMCFNVAGGSTADKAKIVQWPCGRGLNDNFIFTHRGGGYYTISPAHAPGSCLDIDWNRRFDNGVQVEQYRCTGGDNQLFRLIHSGVGYFRVIAKPSGKCLDVAGYSYGAGAAIVQYTCNGGGNQFFRYDAVFAR